MGYLSEAFVSFQGEGLHVGRRQLFLRFCGCPLRCLYCDTPASLVRTEGFVAHGLPNGTYTNPMSLDDISVVVSMLIEQHGPVEGTSLTGGEPLAQADFIAQLLEAGGLPRPVILETAGMMPKALEKVVEAVDVVSMDLKLPSNTGETAFWDLHREFLAASRGKVYVKVLVDASSSRNDLIGAADLVRDVAPETPVFIQPITAESSTILVGEGDLSNVYKIFRNRVEDVRVVPQTHKMLGVA